MKLKNGIQGSMPLRWLGKVFAKGGNGAIFPSFSVASGKGGTGKTFTSVNLAVLLSRTWGNVQFFDADLGLGNAHIHLGVRPEYHLQHFLEGRIEFEDMNLDTPHGLRLLPGGTGLSRLSVLEGEERKRLDTALASFQDKVSLFVVDSAAGITPQTLSYIGLTDLVLLVVTPELTALTDAYALLKCLLRRSPGTQVFILVNRVHEIDEGWEAYEKMQEVSRRFLDFPIHYMGEIPEDRGVRRALAEKVPLVVHDPSSPASRALRNVADRLDEILREISARPGRPDFRSRLLDSI